MILAAAGFPILNELALLFVISIVIAYVSLRVKLPTIAGYLLAGVVIGPSALGVVQSTETVDVLAEVGVILLLFTIGIELSLGKLVRLGRAIFIGGGIQVGVTVLVVTGAVVAAGVSWQAGVYTGCLVALSSTAVVLALLAQRGDSDTPAGRLSLALLIFQDLAIVVMVLLVPMLAGTGGTGLEIAWALAKAIIVIAVVVLLARTAVPWLLERVTRTRQPELFLLAVVAVCMGTAALMSLAGVSVALGAFFAGLVASESRYADQALSEMLPLRTIFSAVFFVSVGMLLDVSFLISNLPLVLLVAVVVVMLKAATTVGSVLALGLPVRVAGAVGLTLAQVGEFSFVLERAGREAGLSPAGFGETGEQVFIASTVLLMMLTPLMSSLGPSFGRLLERTPLHRVGPQKEMEEEKVLKLEDHVVIVGYGPAGRRLVQVLQNTGIPFAVIDINPANVTELQEQGLPALYGDASRALILEHVGILRAKVLAVAINDTGAVPRVIAQAHHMNPTLQIIARTRYLADAEKLQSRGADLVVPEEMETTVRMFSHVLGAYLVPKEEIERQVQSIRAEDYGIVRGGLREAHLMVLQGLDEDGLHTRAVAVRDGAPAAGQTLADLQLRNEFGITVLAVRRGRRTIGSPAGDFLVEPNDRLVLLGSAENFAEAGEVFREPATE